MLSYVLPAKEENGSNKNQMAHRTLSLNLNPQFQLSSSSEDIYEKQESDHMLANVANGSDFCNDLTKLIQNENPNAGTKSFSKNCNNNNPFPDESDVVRGTNEDFDEFDSSILESDSSFKQANMKKTKHCKLGSKNVGLKRVSFGSSKGSMVETLVFETPTPLSEHAEPTYIFECHARSKSPSNNKTQADDSGIDVQEDSERSIVRVSIYQSSKPQQICHPDYLTKLTENLEESICTYLDEDMPSAAISGYDRQQSTDSGWDNPFRPGGDLSREAEEIVNMIKGGKPITPTDDHKVGNGVQNKESHANGAPAIENVIKTNVTQTQTAQNGSGLNNGDSKVKSSDNNGITSSTNQVSKQVVPGPTSASHVVIEEKKNKKKGCCVIQ